MNRKSPSKLAPSRGNARPSGAPKKASAGGSARPARKSSYQPRQKGDWNNVLNPAPTRADKPASRPATKTAAAPSKPAARPASKTAAARPASKYAAANPKPRPAGAAKKAVRAPKFDPQKRKAVKDTARAAESAPLPQAVVHVTVTANEDGQRIDNFLVKCLPGVPKSHIYLILRSGQVRVDGGRAKPERKLSIGENVRIPPVRLAEKKEQVRAPDAVLNRLREAIVHEDEHYLAICKPAGLASHGGTGIAYGVIEAARGWGKYDFLELAHRLDRDTSGVLLLAKSRPGLLRAQRAFREGLADKRYFALLAGRLQGGARDVDAALVKKSIPGGERFIGIDEEDGKPSKSRFVPQAHYRDATLCEVHIYSGRTHQIRVHALALGHPVAGDRKYGLRDDQKSLRDKGLRRMFLHSHFLQLPADGEFGKLILNAPMTEELREFLEVLGPGR